MNTTQELFEKIQFWAVSKKINHAHKEMGLYPQLAKCLEELGEVSECVAKPHKKKELSGEIGDLFITAIILSLQAGYCPEKCISDAFDKIKGRNGKTVNGVFVKESKKI